MRFLTSSFGYSSSGSSTQKQLRRHLIQQQEESFSRPALRRLERYLVNYETDAGESQSSVSMRASTTLGKRRRADSISGLDSTTTTASSEDVSKSLVYSQMRRTDILDEMEARATTLRAPPTGLWNPQMYPHSEFAVYPPPPTEYFGNFYLHSQWSSSSRLQVAHRLPPQSLREQQQFRPLSFHHENQPVTYSWDVHPRNAERAYGESSSYPQDRAQCPPRYSPHSTNRHLGS
ncbi:hypothetical protein BJ742DRAFT_152207 [Cladochytrium replicatum]|nr:hypothetical protein BJ742DRAFT_152207 [Cladochytrium replicatum]